MKRSVLTQYYIPRPNPTHIVSLHQFVKKGDLVIPGTFSKFQWREAFWFWIFCEFQSDTLIRAWIFWRLASKRGLNPSSFFSKRIKTCAVAVGSLGSLQWHGRLLFSAGVGGRGGQARRHVSVLVSSEDEWAPNIYKGCGMDRRDASTYKINISRRG